MGYYIGCDAHKRYSVLVVLDEGGQVRDQRRVEHEPGGLQAYLAGFPAGTPVALETVGHWYWMADARYAAACRPLLAHAAKAKVMMGQTQKTDKLDARGLATLLRVGSLPTVWIPPAEVRDLRELTRSRGRVRVKNRVQATLAKYGHRPPVQDLFGKTGRAWLETVRPSLPPETGLSLAQALGVLDYLDASIQTLEARIRARVRRTPEMGLLQTLPGVGPILASVIALEVGDIGRFPSAAHLASSCGVVPRVRASGGRVRYGPLRADANRFLKWAFIEAGNVVARHHARPSWQGRHVSQLYVRIRQRKGHSKAVGAVARHLAEAAFWVLRKGEPYREPRKGPGMSTSGKART